MPPWNSSGRDNPGVCRLHQLTFQKKADEKKIRIILVPASCLSMAASVFAESGAAEIDYTTGTPWMDCDLDENVTIDMPTDRKALFHGEKPEDHDSRLAYDYFCLLCD